jgi:hypothetical protein
MPMIRWMLTAAALAAPGIATAKLPTPTLDEAAKAKAAETAAKTAWQGKLDTYQLCKAQDRIAARYRSGHPAEARQTATQVAAAAAAPKVTPTAASASQGGSTPVAAVSPAPPIPTCADPGPFAYAPPDQKPLETSGAHSPPATAASPPSVRAESGTMTSGKTGAKK